MYEQHRNLRAWKHIVRHAPQEQPPDASAPMRCHDQQIYWPHERSVVTRSFLTLDLALYPTDDGSRR